MVSKRGFTLIELMIALAVGIVGIAAAFAFARMQIRGLANQDEVARMQTSAQLVLEGLARDIRNAGYGTSFYAGMQAGGFGGSMDMIDIAGDNRGFPAIRVANNAVGPAQVMPGSDAITLLRVTSDSVTLLDPIPCNPVVGTIYPTEPGTITRLRSCLNSNGLVLVSDSSKPTGEPESMLLATNSISLASNGLVFRDGYGINPAGVRCTNNSNPPNGVGAGAFAVCVQPVSYWVDSLARLRMWQPRTDGEATPPATINGRVPIDPTNDAVLVEGIEDLQLALYMSQESGVGAGSVWIHSDPPTSIVGNEGQIAEARVVRISAIARTTRSLTETNLRREALLTNNFLEDHLLPANPVIGCTNPAACYDPAFTRKLIRFQAELRNMRIFDVLSSNTRTWNDMRSFR